MLAIEARSLTKRFHVAKSPGLPGAVKHLFRPRFEVKVAVDHVDLRIEPGEMVGYVGPNGVSPPRSRC